MLDFDGFLVNSYNLLKQSFEHFGLDVGDEDRFRHRRKFLKYLGGGKEFVGNFVNIALPPQKKVRVHLTGTYQENGRVFPEFVPLLNHMIASPRYHVGIVSRNFTYTPGLTIRRVLANSDVNEKDIDFIVPIPVGAKKKDVLQAMQSTRYRQSIFGADEVSDYNAATESGYEDIIMASYGFDSKKRLLEKGHIDRELIFDSPNYVVKRFEELLA